MTNKPLFENLIPKAMNHYILAKKYEISRKSFEYS
jgi:hypothetical protein